MENMIGSQDIKISLFTDIINKPKGKKKKGIKKTIITNSPP